MPSNGHRIDDVNAPETFTRLSAQFFTNDASFLELTRAHAQRQVLGSEREIRTKK